MAITYDKQVITKDRRVMPSGPRDRQRKQQMEHVVVADNSAIIEELRFQIASLQDRLAAKPTVVSQAQVGSWTDDQVNAEIAKAIKEETVELKKQHDAEKKKFNAAIDEYKQRAKTLEKQLSEVSTKIVLLEKDIDVMNEKLSEKERIIKELRDTRPDLDNKLTTLLAEATKKIETLSIQVANAGTADAVIVGTDRPQMETVFVDPIEKEGKVEKHFDVEVEDVSTNKKEEMAGKVDKLRNLLGKLPTKR